MKDLAKKGLAFAMTALLGLGLANASNNDKVETDFEELIESLEVYSEEAYLEAHGLTKENKVVIYDMKEGVVLESNIEELSTEDYTKIFQSDFVMESAGTEYYIINK